MEPERWRQIEDLFHTALDCEPGRRAVFLDSACAGDASLRKDIESLLSSYEVVSSEPSNRVRSTVGSSNITERSGSECAPKRR